MKTTLLIILFAAMTALCFGIFQFGLGVDVAGNQQIETVDHDVPFGTTPSIEYLKQYENFMYGVGAAYQVQRDVDNHDGKMGFIPLYGVLRYQFSTLFHVAPEIVAQGGYNFFTADVDYLNNDTTGGGLYWGVGAGVSINQKYLFQIMFQNDLGKIKIEQAADLDITDTQIDISLGVRI